jgi:hypothetical protein
MSLLNDALKRAGENDPGRGSRGPVLPPLQPVQYAAGPNWFWRAALVLALVVAVGMSLFFLNRWLSTAGAPAEAKNRVLAVKVRSFSGTDVGREPRTAVGSPAAIRVNTNLGPRDELVSPSTVVAVTSTPRATNVPTVVTGAVGAILPATSAVPPVAEATFPVLKLQSIIFRLRAPSALINGEMLGVGDTIEGARVLKIDRHTVTLEWKGQTNALTLPRL